MVIDIAINKNFFNWNYKKFITKKLIENVLFKTVNKFDNLKKVKKFELSILLTNNQEMLRLNTLYRNKAKATNVLSFPDIELNSKTLEDFIPNINYMYLGDIAFGYETIEIEALKYNIDFQKHFTHLLVHSILHIIGFDHNNEEETKIMESLEKEILKTI